jgi:hypothetical protein
MTEYNGHRSWNAWNTALWIANDEGLYRLALDCLRRHRNRRAAARALLRELGGPGTRTPDGGRYNLTCLYAALEGLS